MDDLTGLMAVIFIFGTPAILVAMAMVRNQFAERHRRKERAEARRIYERLMHHKLDVVESALAMGYTRDEVAELDSRLERLIGAERMRTLLDPKEQALPVLPESADTDELLQREVAAIRRQREAT